MLPILLEIGPLSVHTYGLMIGIGVIVSVSLIRRDGSRVGISPRDIHVLCFGGVVAGLVGARILNIVMFLEQYSWSRPFEWFALWEGGLAVQGAIPTILLWFYFVTRFRKIPFRLFIDVATTYTPLMQTFGRVGCFFYGCCHGIPTSMPWGIRFPRVPWDLSKPPTGSTAYMDHCNRYQDFLPGVEHWSRPVHPTQLYEASFFVVLFVVMLRVRAHFGTGSGYTLAFYLMSYGVWRFFIEFLRNDSPMVCGGMMSEPQFYSIFILLSGMIMFGCFRYFDRSTTRLTVKPLSR